VLNVYWIPNDLVTLQHYLDWKNVFKAARSPTIMTGLRQVRVLTFQFVRRSAEDNTDPESEAFDERARVSRAFVVNKAPMAGTGSFQDFAGGHIYCVYIASSVHDCFLPDIPDKVFQLTYKISMSAKFKFPTSSSVKREFLDYIPDVLKPGAGLPDIVLPLEFDEQRAVEVRKAVFKDEVYG
jgi:hypothetical protein